MNNVHLNSLQYFVLIADQKKKNKFISLLGNYGAHCIEVIYGHGSMTPNAVAAAFGFENNFSIGGEIMKVVISCLVKYEDALKLTEILYSDYKFSKPNTGIAYSIPVEGLAF